MAKHYFPVLQPDHILRESEPNAELFKFDMLNAATFGLSKMLLWNIEWNFVGVGECVLQKIVNVFFAECRLNYLQSLRIVLSVENLAFTETISETKGTNQTRENIIYTVYSMQFHRGNGEQCQ